VNIFGGLPRFFFSVFIAFSPYFFYSAIADFLTAVRSYSGLGCPQQAFVFLSVCGTKYYACYFSRTSVRFFRLSIFSLLRLSLFISEFLANLLLAILLFGVNQFYLFSAQLLRSSGGSLMKM
jgi:hypothetical protein